MAEEQATALEAELEAPPDERESPQTVSKEQERVSAPVRCERSSGGHTAPVVA